MRPIDKGPCPILPEGTAKTVSDYTSWRQDLIDRIGFYCAYCNIPLSHGIQVEHVVPKNPLPGQPAGHSLAWENMSLACGPCNNSKDNNPVADVYLPEMHNGYLPFQTELRIHNGRNHAIVIPRQSDFFDPSQHHLNADQQKKAEATIELLKWQKIDARDAVVDVRSQRRAEVLESIQLVRAAYQGNIVPEMLLLIKELIKHTGFFLLWVEAFRDEPDVMELLANPAIFPGVDPRCFDPSNGFRPIPRNLQDPRDPY